MALAIRYGLGRLRWGFTLGAMHYYLAMVYFWSGNPIINGFLFPISGPMLIAIMIRGIWMCITKKVTWRGTSYAHVMAPKLADVTPVEPPIGEP